MAQALVKTGLAALLLCNSGASAAQPVLAGTSLHIGGMLVGCGGAPVYLDNNLADIAWASITPQGRFITLNPSRMALLAPVVQVFVFAHECGHLVTAGSEMTADCWAIQNGKINGWFGPANYPYLVDMMRNNPGDFTHPPGPARLANIEVCYAAV